MKKFFLSIIVLLYSAEVLANQPKNWQLGFQEPASQTMRDIVWFHDYMFCLLYTSPSPRDAS